MIISSILHKQKFVSQSRCSKSETLHKETHYIWLLFIYNVSFISFFQNKKNNKDEYKKYHTKSPKPDLYNSEKP